MTLGMLAAWVVGAVISEEAQVSVAEIIRDKLNRALKPVRLEIIDDSHRHEGHAGAKDGGETHFNVEVVSADFSDMPRVARQRLIYAALSVELEGQIHALSIRALTPEEDG
jgi:BolA protein